MLIFLPTFLLASRHPFLPPKNLLTSLPTSLQSVDLTSYISTVCWPPFIHFYNLLIFLLTTLQSVDLSSYKSTVCWLFFLHLYNLLTFLLTPLQSDYLSSYIITNVRLPTKQYISVTCSLSSRYAGALMGFRAAMSLYHSVKLVAIQERWWRGRHQGK